MLADFEPTTLADAVVAALADPERLAEQGARGRAYVEAHHSPDRLRQSSRPPSRSSTMPDVAVVIGNYRAKASWATASRAWRHQTLRRPR